ncbi:MAG TPA: Uma2 family endonuclease [Pirellulales bacterium]|nr:Uma2 family endonuclease [Pirellulales bacterium]HVA48159.1 Uma2 family endonuclease [Pirellulales bacterium]
MAKGHIDGNVVEIGDMERLDGIQAAERAAPWWPEANHHGYSTSAAFLSATGRRWPAIEGTAQEVKCGWGHKCDQSTSIFMATIERLLTAEEYAQLPDNGAPTELVRGRIVDLDIPAFRHGWLCVRVAKLLANYVDDHELGRVLGNDAGMITERNPDTVRGPDISFFSYSRIPKGASLEGYAQVAPEVVFEVRSPGDRWPRILERVSEFLNAGVLAIYVVDAKKELATVFDAASDEPSRILKGGDELTFPAPLSGLRIAVQQLFA